MVAVMEKQMTGKQKRFESLLPLVDGLRTPKWIRCYDNGGTEGKQKNRMSGEELGTMDRYTVVFTGHYTHKTGGQHWDLTMNCAPFHPQGIGMHGENRGPIDRPTSGHLGKRINFKDLPEQCQRLVIQDYKYLWDLDKDENGCLEPIHPHSVNPFI